MSSKQQGMTILLALVAGLTGGLLSSQFLSGQPVFAQRQLEHKKVLRAEIFELVDDEGNLRGSLTEQNGSVVLRLAGKRSSFLNAFLTRTSADLELGTYAKGKISVHVGTKGFQISLADRLDPARVRAVLGDVNLQDEVTGQIETRGPSSLVLFDEDGRVLWKGP